VAFPVHAVAPWQTSNAPATEAADGPAGSRAALVACPSPASASAAPGPVAAVEVDCTWQPPAPPVQDAVPVEVRGAAVVSSNAVVVVVTEPVQAVSQFSAASERATEDGPANG
jgi:hypothetical protein